MIRKGLLKDLLQIESVSGKEELMYDIILKELAKLGFTAIIDDVGNISATRGKSSSYPLLNAHMDIVDLSYDNYFFANSFDKPLTEDIEFDILRDMLFEIRTYHDIDTRNPLDFFNNESLKYYVMYICEENGFDFEDSYQQYLDMYEVDENSMYDLELEYQMINESIINEPYEIIEENNILKGVGKNRVLGGDDKCGIFIALEIARILKDKPLKILFTVQEENGCVGISHFIKTNLKWFKDVIFSITIDRRENDNLLPSQLGTRSCVDSFTDKLITSARSVGIEPKIMDGNVADVIYIRDVVPNSVNMSAGYFDAHTSKEYVDINGVQGIIKWLCKFLKE